MNRRWVAIHFFVILIADPAQASTADLDMAVLRSLRLPQTSITSSERRDIAQRSLAYWKSFESRVPRNSPADRQWLDEELATTDSTRLTRAVNTPQYALSQLEALSTNCAKVFEKLEAAVGTDRFEEAYLWLKTVQCVGDGSRTARYLQQAGLSDGTYDGPFSLQHFNFLLEQLSARIANSLASE